jgi:hypothetical protein
LFASDRIARDVLSALEKRLREDDLDRMIMKLANISIAAGAAGQLSSLVHTVSSPMAELSLHGA